MSQEIQQFAGKQIRTYWNDDEEKYYFCIIDVVEALTDSKDPADYFKKLRKRDSELDTFVRGTNCPPHQFISSDGKRHNPKCIDVQGLLRIIQSIPSKKAEPFKRWLAQVGADRIHQMQDPELGIQQSLADFKRLGYSDNWINQRLKSIEIRKDLTDIIYQSWAGLTAKEYKHLKGLHKENLRDNMTNEELVMNMLAELTTTNITQEEHPVTMDEHSQAAARGGSVARVAREAFELQTGKKVVSKLSMKRYIESQKPQLDFPEDDNPEAMENKDE